MGKKWMKQMWVVFQHSSWQTFYFCILISLEAELAAIPIIRYTLSPYYLTVTLAYNFHRPASQQKIRCRLRLKAYWKLAFALVALPSLYWTPASLGILPAFQLLWEPSDLVYLFTFCHYWANEKLPMTSKTRSICINNLKRQPETVPHYIH